MSERVKQSVKYHRIEKENEDNLNLRQSVFSFNIFKLNFMSNPEFFLYRRFGGAITAALYLSEFLDPMKSKKSEDKDSNDEMNDKEIIATTNEKNKIDSKESGSTVSATNNGDSLNENEVVKSSMVWFHVDFMGSKGGNAEPQGMRAVYEYIKSEYVK